MAALKVPERYISGIVLTAQIRQEGFDQLLAALKSAPACNNSRELLAWISGETPAITEQDRRAIIDSILPMLMVQRSQEVSVERFVSDVWDSIAESAPSKAKKVDGDVLKLRTSQLLSESALDLPSSRIDEAKQEVERNFCKVKIMTDLRPAFKKDPTQVPSEVAVIHNFQIGFHDGMNKHQEFYVSLDADDLNALKKAIADAEKRVQTLEQLFKDGVNLHK